MNMNLQRQTTDTWFSWNWTSDGWRENNIYKFHIFFKKIHLFIYWAVLGLSRGMWDLDPRLEIEPEPLALGAWSQPWDHEASPCKFCVFY